jgi:hypothetical protein
MISLGTVAEDKNDNSRFISVYLKEALPFHENEINGEFVNVRRTGVDADGNKYDITHQRGGALKAEWRMDGNRITSPNVRRGETVEVWTSGDSSIYFWSEVGRHNHLRRTERVVWGYAADKTPVTEDVMRTADNSYTVEVNSKKKHITVKTTMANDEIAKYTIQMNGGSGTLTICDQNNNIIQINTPQTTITLKNAAGTYISLNNSVINMKASKVLIDADVEISGYCHITREVTASNESAGGD